MSESPQLIGRNRVRPAALPIGLAAALKPRSLVDADAKTAPGFTGKKIGEINAEHQEWLDAQPTVTRCAFCAWSYEGPASIGRDAARQHREAKHPEVVGRRTPRRRNGMSRVRPEVKMTDAEYEDAARARAEKDEESRLASIERGRQRQVLEAMDAGEPQEVLEDREESPIGSGAPGLETDGAAAVVSSPRGDSGPVDPAPLAAEAASSQLGDGASTSTEGETMQTVAERLGLRKFGRGYIWTREAMIEAVKAWHAEHGESPGREASKRSPIGTLPNGEKAKEEFGGWAALLEAAGLPPTQTGPKSSDRAERPAPAPRPESSRPAPQPQPEPSRDLVVVAEPSLRDPIRTADIPYDADILENEAEFLRARADALDNLAAAIRTLDSVSRRNVAEIAA